jgi:hypothetical protein
MKGMCELSRAEMALIEGGQTSQDVIFLLLILILQIVSQPPPPPPPTPGQTCLVTGTDLNGNPIVSCTPN